MKDKASCVHLGVGVDTARYAHHVSFLDEKKRTAAKHETRLVNQLHGLLARVFPELAVHLKDLSASYVLTLLDKLIENAWKTLPEGPHRRILTIKGIGLQTAAALVAKIVSIDRFQTAGTLIGYFGVFPEEVDVSGTDRQGNPKQGNQLRMSRKGNDLVRRLLYTAAQCGVKWNPPVKALFARQMAEGKEYNVAIGHCMAKLLRP